MLTLSVAEVRVLGSLMEKEMTTPEYYPLSLNALVNACNQRSSRDPVMELSEAEVRTALFELESLELVRVLADARVSKFEHRMYDRLALRRPEVTALCLLLRGPQTVAELRGRAERMYQFDDTAAVSTTLERMATREDQNGSPAPLVVQMARQPGARESRWMHLLSGSVESSVQPAGQANMAEDSAGSNITGRVAELERLVNALEERVALLESSMNSLRG